MLVATQAYHGSEALTYSATEPLQPGAIVKVALRNRPVLGIILRTVAKPLFDVKPVMAVAPFPTVASQTLELLKWIYAYYPAPLGAVVRLFVPPTEVFPKATDIRMSNPEVSDREFDTSTLRGSAADLPLLTLEQTKALAAINGPGTFLLHGITGSGKSRVYIELAQRTVKAGKSALILTPEIGLTAQLTESFATVFGNKVYVLHSQLTAAQRRDIWYVLLASTEPIIVIGPRSALFSPLRNIGLIVVDESHDNAYKNESAPHYHATRVAAKLASLNGASLVLGSATPSVEDYYLAEQRGRPIIAMQNLAITDSRRSEASNALPTSSGVGKRDSLHIKMVDMRKPEAFTRSPILSTALLERIAVSMKAGEQSLLFLNRRGTANAVLCSSCGWLDLCPNCDLSLTYHGDEHALRCHVCGYKSGLPTSCPVCGNTEILFKSIGTKAVMDQLQKLFPAARLQRFDSDTKKVDRLEQHVRALAGGSADIIVGTQMVGKGLDLPKLSTVGIINADSSLLIPDYTATEHTYQLISQVVGRVGRGHRAGTVVVQTYDPKNMTLQAALRSDWSTFYQSELRERRAYHFPPFVYVLQLHVLRASSKSAETAAKKLASQLAADFPAVTVEGPAASFHPRAGGKYSWQLLLKATHRQTLLDVVAMLPSGWAYTIDPTNLL